MHYITSIVTVLYISTVIWMYFFTVKDLVRQRKLRHSALITARIHKKLGQPVPNYSNLEYIQGNFIFMYRFYKGSSRIKHTELLDAVSRGSIMDKLRFIVGTFIAMIMFLAIPIIIGLVLIELFKNRKKDGFWKSVVNTTREIFGEPDMYKNIEYDYAAAFNELRALAELKRVHRRIQKQYYSSTPRINPKAL